MGFEIMKMNEDEYGEGQHRYFMHLDLDNIKLKNSSK
jgi:hypothetical protein